MYGGACCASRFHEYTHTPRPSRRGGSSVESIGRRTMQKSLGRILGIGVGLVACAVALWGLRDCSRPTVLSSQYIHTHGAPICIAREAQKADALPNSRSLIHRPMLRIIGIAPFDHTSAPPSDCLLVYADNSELTTALLEFAAGSITLPSGRGVPVPLGGKRLMPFGSPVGITLAFVDSKGTVKKEVSTSYTYIQLER